MMYRREALRGLLSYSDALALIGQVHDVLDAHVWSADTAPAIAALLTAAGLVIDEPAGG